MICNGSLCEYLTGPPGTGVRVNESAVFSKKVVYAAIDTASLTDAATITADDFVCQANAYLLFVSFIVCLVIRRRLNLEVLRVKFEVRRFCQHMFFWTFQPSLSHHHHHHHHHHVYLLKNNNSVQFPVKQYDKN